MALARHGTCRVWQDDAECGCWPLLWEEHPSETLRHWQHVLGKPVAFEECGWLRTQDKGERRPQKHWDTKSWGDRASKVPTFTSSPQESEVTLFLCCKIEPDAEEGLGRRTVPLLSGACGHSLTWLWQVQRDYLIIYSLFWWNLYPQTQPARQPWKPKSLSKRISSAHQFPGDWESDQQSTPFPRLLGADRWSRPVTLLSALALARGWWKAAQRLQQATRSLSTVSVLCINRSCVFHGQQKAWPRTVSAALHIFGFIFHLPLFCIGTHTVHVPAQTVLAFSFFSLSLSSILTKPSPSLITGGQPRKLYHIFILFEAYCTHLCGLVGDNFCFFNKMETSHTFFFIMIFLLNSTSQKAIWAPGI